MSKIFVIYIIRLYYSIYFIRALNSYLFII